MKVGEKYRAKDYESAYCDYIIITRVIDSITTCYYDFYMKGSKDKHHSTSVSISSVLTWGKLVNTKIKY